MKKQAKLFITTLPFIFIGCTPFETYEHQSQSSQVIIIPEAPSYSNNQLEYERQKNAYERYQNELERQENEIDRQINEYERQQIELERIYSQ